MKQATNSDATKNLSDLKAKVTDPAIKASISAKQKALSTTQPVQK